MSLTMESRDYKPIAKAGLQQAAKPRILVIDDTEEIREVLVALLQNHYQVSTASSGSQGLACASVPEAQRPDIILLDVMMPDMDGYAVMRQLASDVRTADIPVIFLTALSSVAEEQRGLDVGATDYITKPISPPILLARVRMHLERSSNARRLKHLSEQLSRYLAPQVYQSLFDGTRQAQIQTQRKPLTVFFSDIKDFTASTAAWQPDKVTLLLNHYFAEMSEIAAEYGATLDKFIGDAIVIFFGDPHTLGIERDALQCVRMAIAMQQRMQALHQRWSSMGIHKSFEIRIGIHSGLCDVGNFGSNLRMEYTIIGREVNLAARLEQAAQPGQIIISRETAELVQPHVKVSPQPAVQAKGFIDPIAVFAVSLEESDEVAAALQTGPPVMGDSRPAPPLAAAAYADVQIANVSASENTTEKPHATTTENEVSLPDSIAGLDLDIGLARAMRQVPLYGLLLRRFASSRQDTAIHIREAIATGDLAHAELLSHSLRGVAAQLGATQVPFDAEQLEMALRKGKSLESLNPLLEKLEQSLGILIGALNAVWPVHGCEKNILPK